MHNQCEEQFANIIYEEYHILQKLLFLYKWTEMLWLTEKKKAVFFCRLFIQQYENQFSILVKSVLVAIKKIAFKVVK